MFIIRWKDCGDFECPNSKNYDAAAAAAMRRGRAMAAAAEAQAMKDDIWRALGDPARKTSEEGSKVVITDARISAGGGILITIEIDILRDELDNFDLDNIIEVLGAWGVASIITDFLNKRLHELHDGTQLDNLYYQARENIAHALHDGKSRTKMRIIWDDTIKDRVLKLL